MAETKPDTSHRCAQLLIGALQELGYHGVKLDSADSCREQADAVLNFLNDHFDGHDAGKVSAFATRVSKLLASHDCECDCDEEDSRCSALAKLIREDFGDDKAT